MDATIIEIGNSQGVRISKAYLDKLGLKKGDRVTVTIHKSRKDKQKALAALESISEMNGTLANLDVNKWQSNRRAVQRRKDDRLGDILGR